MSALPPRYPKRRRRRDWAGLPSALLGEILTRLPLPDRVRFGRVCSPWRSALLDSCRTSRLPSWLTLSPYGPHDHLFGLDRGKLYRLRLRLRRSRHRIGSSMGWLVVAAREPNFEIHLLNPISGQQIDLPCYSEHPIKHVCGAVLSSPPTSEDCIVVVITWTKLAWCRLRGGGWAIVEDPPSDFTDILFQNGELYVLTITGEVLVYAFDPQPRQRRSIAPRERFFWLQWLVESGQELLLVERPFTGHAVHVYKLDVENSRWVRIEGLDGRVLLISGVGAESFSTTEDIARSGLEPNCIYYSWHCESNELFKFSMEDDRLYQIELNGRGRRVIELDQMNAIEYVA